jgi:hypothetical protein
MEVIEFWCPGVAATLTSIAYAALFGFWDELASEAIFTKSKHEVLYGIFVSNEVLWGEIDASGIREFTEVQCLRYNFESSVGGVCATKETLSPPVIMVFTVFVLSLCLMVFKAVSWFRPEIRRLEDTDNEIKRRQKELLNVLRNQHQEVLTRLKNLVAVLAGNGGG